MAIKQKTILKKKKGMDYSDYEYNANGSDGCLRIWMPQFQLATCKWLETFLQTNKVRTLSLQFCKIIDVVDYFNRILRESQIEELHLINCFFDLRSLSDTIKQMPFLVSLSFSDSEKSLKQTSIDCIVDILDHNSNIQFLWLGGKLLCNLYRLRLWCNAEASLGPCDRSNNVDKLFDVIGRNITLLCIDTCEFPHEDFLKRVTKLLNTNMKLKSLSVCINYYNYDVGKKEDWSAFSDAVGKNAHLEELGFRCDSSIDQPSFQQFISSVAQNKNIISLIVFPTLPMDGFVLLPVLPNMKKLSLININVDEKLGYAIERCDRLRYLYVGSYDIEREQAAYVRKFAESVRKNGNIIDGDLIFRNPQGRLGDDSGFKRNKLNYETAKDGCLRLLAMKKFRQVPLIQTIGPDMTTLLSKFLMKTFPDYESWSGEGEQTKKLKIV